MQIPIAKKSIKPYSRYPAIPEASYSNHNAFPAGQDINPLFNEVEEWKAVSPDELSQIMKEFSQSEGPDGVTPQELDSLQTSQERMPYSHKFESLFGSSSSMRAPTLDEFFKGNNGSGMTSSNRQQSSGSVPNQQDCILGSYSDNGDQHRHQNEGRVTDQYKSNMQDGSEQKFKYQADQDESYYNRFRDLSAVTPNDTNMRVTDSQLKGARPASGDVLDNSSAQYSNYYSGWDAGAYPSNAYANNPQAPSYGSSLNEYSQNSSLEPINQANFYPNYYYGNNTYQMTRASPGSPSDQAVFSRGNSGREAPASDINTTSSTPSTASGSKFISPSDNITSQMLQQSLSGTQNQCYAGTQDGYANMRSENAQANPTRAYLGVIQENAVTAAPFTQPEPEAITHMIFQAFGV